MSFSRLVKNWREFEHFIASLYRDKEDVEVRHDVKLQDRDGNERQIDVLVRFRHGAHRFMVIIEAKYWNKPIERQQIDELVFTVQKLNANKGVFFTTVGYQEGALRAAEANGIDIFCVRNPTSDNWWPLEPHQIHLQVCSFAIADRLKLDVAKDAEIGTTDGVFPSGLRVIPSIKLHPVRTKTPLLERADGKTLEDVVEGALVQNLPPVVKRVTSPRGVIGGGGDCVGYTTFDFDLNFPDRLIVQERVDPFVIVRYSRIVIPTLIRIEQRVLRWKPFHELAFAVVVENAISGQVYQVARAHAEPFPNWMPMAEMASAAGLPNNACIVTVAQENFRPELFVNPWNSYGNVSTLGIEDIPPSQAVQRILGILKSPLPTPQVISR